mmetsp:Transcript_21582/g.53231  ORF Transcript_21582/g.53231 Transcript_21582/m.53231 type:complete len:116 (+) Transcript_21582:191-538(+)
MFWGELSVSKAKFDAVGVVDSTLRTVGFWNIGDAPDSKFSTSSHDFKEGVVWYIRGGIIVGALLWNMQGKGIKKARELIGSKFAVQSTQTLGEQVPLPPSDFRLVLDEEGVASEE